MYIAEKAIYGLRRSPRLWSEHRDRILESLEVKLEDRKGNTVRILLQPLPSEPNLWTMRFEGEGKLRGLLMTYVDDLIIVGEDRAAAAAHCPPFGPHQTPRSRPQSEKKV